MSFSTDRNTYRIATWTEFKKYIDGTYCSAAYSYEELSSYYIVLTEAIGGVRKEVTITKDGGANQIDFDTNFKNITPRIPISNKIFLSDDTILGANNPIPVSGTVNVNSVSATKGLLNTSFAPDDKNIFTTNLADLSLDAENKLQTRGQILTDEGSFRDDFSGNSLTFTGTGTVTFTNGSTTVLGIGTLFTTELTFNEYIKKVSDNETLYVRISEIISDTELILMAGYAGTTATTTFMASSWDTTTPAGGSITVSNSEVLLAPSTTNNNYCSILHTADYPPYILSFNARITQRIANQYALIGFVDDEITLNKRAIVYFDGTSNTNLKFITSYSNNASDIQTTNIVLQNGLNTSQTLFYQIDLSANMAVLTINNNVVATHNKHIPGPYDVMSVVAGIKNQATVTATTLALDTIFFQNLDQLQITNSFIGEPQKVVVVNTANTNGFVIAYVATAATTLQSVRATTYTEQTTNAQRSIVSSSANDTAAGTGARQVTITYLDASGNGPYTETVTLNGTTAVNTTNTNICYIEKMESTSVGSGGINAGIISLKSATAGGGTTIGTIAVGDILTFWGHHYVPVNKTANITGLSIGHNGTVVGSGGLFVIRGKSLLTGTTSPEKQYSDFIRLYGQSSTIVRTYLTPIQIQGPARITLYVTPESTSALTYRSAIDFYEN